MLRRSFLFAAALAAASLIGSAAHAAGILVNTDSGSLGGFTLTNMGISGGGVITLQLVLLSPLDSHIETVNGAGVPNNADAKATFQQPIMLTLTPTGGGMYSVGLDPATYTKTFGTGAATAQLSWDLTKAATLPAPFGNFLQLTGSVTGVNSNLNPSYDFSRFSGGGQNNITLTATSYSNGFSSFAQILGVVGASATGSGAFSEIATVVPEPASMALLGIGLSGLLLSFRRLVRRVTTA